MKPTKYCSVGFLIATSACSATGRVDAPEADAGAPSDEGGTVIVDAGSPVEEPPVDAGADAERSLACGDAGFCETRLPTSELGSPLSLRSVWAVGPNDVWSVTTEGYVLHYDGAQWRVDYRTNHELLAVWGTTSDVWVGGDAGLLMHRNAAGEWTLLETNHVQPIRSIFGTGPNDVWFTRDGASLDHFDGVHLDNHPVDVPGLKLRVLFGRAGLGVYAAGYVPGPLSGRFYTDRSHVFTVSSASVSPFNTSLPLQSGFAAVSATVIESEPKPKLFVLGYRASSAASSSRFVSTELAEGTSVSLTFMIPAPTQEEIARPVPVAARAPSDTWVVRGMGLIHRWSGTTYTSMSLAMGYDVSPAPVFGAHGTSSELWIVGSGFALRGSNP